VPNMSYSGPNKPKLAEFQEVPFTTDTAEYDVLQSPSSATKIDFGYIPQQDVPAKPANLGFYTGFPTNVKDITVVSPTELTMVMDKSYNPTWFLYNELSQITPMPAAWDRTASGPSD